MSLVIRKKLIKEIFIAFRQLLTAIIAWCFAYPLTCFFKRDPDLTVVIGRQGRVFADNSKYFFIAATQFGKPNHRVVFLTNNDFIHTDIIEAGGQSVLHPSWRSLQLVLACGNLVADMADWFDYGVYQLSLGARRVQIWHGAPLKLIELDLYHERLANMPTGPKLLLKLQKTMLGRFPIYDEVIATSQGFIDSAFSRCFSAHHFIASGYPRNDVLLGWPEPDSVATRLLGVNVDNHAKDAVCKACSQGIRIVLYVPTFRKGMDDPFAEDIELTRLSDFASRHNCLVVLKLHPFMQGQYKIEQYPNILEYAPLGDIYPLMAECDILITDYSSIYFDFLLLDKPIVFFATDLETYLTQDRGMYFDYALMTPGAKCDDYEQLETQLAFILSHDGDDGYADKRAEIRAFTHQFVDNQAGKRLCELLYQ
jgi:CDP-glycerol glycerophosphotransferase (TagB/SpsB family)